MPRTRATAKAAEPVEPTKAEEQLQLDDNEESMEEEVEYEEVEEEVEEEEEEEEDEEIVEEIEEVEEEEDEKIEVTNRVSGSEKRLGNDNRKGVSEDNGESKKHDELLALPPHGSEVYVGGISNDASEEELKSFCEKVGEVTEVRLMKGKESSENRGYAFVTFRTKELASKAIKELSNTEFKGRKIKCSSSQAKNKLFIGNIPKTWTEDELKKEVEIVGPGVMKVQLLKDPHNSGRNRGYAFVEYHNHACAEYSRDKMSSPDFKLESNAPTVSWADPKNGDSASSSQVKALYVKNLPKNITENQLKKLFEHHGKITKVVLPPAKAGHENRYGFVHFAERSMAMKALKNTEKYELDGQVLECSLAKPQAERKDEATSSSQKGALLPMYSPAGYGLVGAYGALPTGIPQHMGAFSPGGSMVPMILPDGRLAYVLQQPGTPTAAPSRDGGQRGGSGSSGNRQNSDKNRGGRYRPY